MYTQNINIKNNCEKANFKEFPNKSAIKQMQALKAYGQSDTTDKITSIPHQSGSVLKKKTANSTDILTSIILGLIVTDCNIESDDIFAILISGILTL